jgi:hypothetical protein
MKIFDFIQMTISHHLNDPHSKALEPDRLSLFPFDYDTVSRGRGKSEGVKLLPIARIDGIFVEGRSLTLQVYRQ